MSWRLYTETENRKRIIAVYSRLLFICKVDFTVSWFSFLCLWRLNCNCQKRGVLRALHSILLCCRSWCSELPGTSLYHFETINWIGTHWRGTRRRSPVKGVNSVNNFCVCDSFVLVSHFLFHILFLLLSVCRFQHLINTLMLLKNQIAN